MRSKFCLLAAIFYLSLGLIANAGASEAVSWEGTGQIWEVSGSGATYFYALNESNDYLAVLNNTKKAKIEIYQESNTYYLDLIGIGTTKDLTLGTSGKFYFSFNNDSFTGSLSNDADDPDTHYMTYNGKEITIISTTVHPSAVPLPSTALLLGSSILGLVGIGSRRKKA